MRYGGAGSASRSLPLLVRALSRTHSPPPLNGKRTRGAKKRHGAAWRRAAVAACRGPVCTHLKVASRRPLRLANCGTDRDIARFSGTESRAGPTGEGQVAADAIRQFNLLISGPFVSRSPRRRTLVRHYTLIGCGGQDIRFGFDGSGPEQVDGDVFYVRRGLRSLIDPEAMQPSNIWRRASAMRTISYAASARPQPAVNCVAERALLPRVMLLDQCCVTAPLGAEPTRRATGRNARMRRRVFFRLTICEPHTLPTKLQSLLSWRRRPARTARASGPRGTIRPPVLESAQSERFPVDVLPAHGHDLSPPATPVGAGCSTPVRRAPPSADHRQELPPCQARRAPSARLLLGGRAPGPGRILDAVVPALLLGD